MKMIKSITIPSQCNEQWQQMTPVAGGRYCECCCKTVVDFTAMADVEIISYFAVKSNVCGRFSEPQLTRVNLQLNGQDTKAETSWKKWVITTAMLASTVFYKVAGQTAPVAPKVEQVSESHPTGATNRKTVTVKEPRREIKGRIVDDARMPLPGATVRVMGTNIVLPTDTNGGFKFHAPIAAKQFTVSFVGFETETVDIDSLQSGACDLKMTPQVISMKDVMVIRGYQVQRCTSIVGSIQTVSIAATKRHCWLWRMYYKYIRTPIHNIFY
jgi:hypothetical protein